jgi:HAD superfamily phosphoserine phosphatase-like hydrolase
MLMVYYIFFDMDGVLTPQAQALVLAETIGKKKEAMRVFAGQLKKQVGLEWILSKGAQFLAGHDAGILSKAALKMQYTKGAKEAVKALKDASYQPIIVTNGFEEMARVFGKRIGIEECYGNIPAQGDGLLTGEIADGKLLTLKSKGDFVRSYLKSRGIDRESTVAVGNDENDMFMFREVGLSIAFNPSSSIKHSITNSFTHAIDGQRRDFIEFTKAVDIVILNNDMTKILPFLIPNPNKFAQKIDEATRL